MRALVGIGVVAAVLSGCWNRHLRGTSEPSKDGRTYLVVNDANGGSACDRIRVDGRPWPHRLHQPGEIQPGTHVIECGGQVEFEVRAGTVFRFNYWGP